MARCFAKVSEEETKTAFFYPSDLVKTKTTIPLRVGEERWIYTETRSVEVYIHYYSPPLRGIVGWWCNSRWERERLVTPSELCYLDSGKHNGQEQSVDGPWHLCMYPKCSSLGKPYYPRTTARGGWRDSEEVWSIYMRPLSLIQEIAIELMTNQNSNFWTNSKVARQINI